MSFMYDPQQGVYFISSSPLGYVRLEYGTFGYGTYGMTCDFDSAEHTICVRSLDSAYRMIDRIASGWRAVNW